VDARRSPRIGHSETRAGTLRGLPDPVKNQGAREWPASPRPSPFPNPPPWARTTRRSGPSGRPTASRCVFE